MNLAVRKFASLTLNANNLKNASLNVRKQWKGTTFDASPLKRNLDAMAKEFSSEVQDNHELWSRPLP